MKWVRLSKKVRGSGLGLDQVYIVCPPKEKPIPRLAYMCSDSTFPVLTEQGDREALSRTVRQQIDL